MKRIELNGAWTLRGRRQGDDSCPMLHLSATVPGMAQLELSREGILPQDLYMGMNITETEAYEDYEWWYERTFDAPEVTDRAYLVFRGVDCLAEYYLNGERIGESDNMLIPHEFCVSDKLRPGRNTLCVHLTSPLVKAHGIGSDLFAIHIARRPTNVYTAVRRAIHSYGWDIMPRAVTAGIWRDVYLELRDSIRFTQVFFDFSTPEARFSFETESRFEDFREVELEVSATCGDSRVYFRQGVRAKNGTIPFTVENPKLWWPYGYGDPNLYDATLRIYAKGVLVHEMHTRFGIRTVQLERTPLTDGYSGCFRFLVNGEEIMCKGSNWVPLDAFHSRDAERYAEALSLVKDIGCNILRCWGGNVYEDHAFFDFCDENGILIWQDFAMACYTYPENEDFYEQMRREVRSVVREFRHHPCILLWSGDNEIDYAYMIGRDTYPSMNTITRRLIPEVVRLNDVGRPYLESSPFWDDRLKTDKGVHASEAHLWGIRDYYKSDFYKQSKAHFVSETGYHGCPSMQSIRKFITPENVFPYHNSEWNLHSTDQQDRSHRVMLMEDQVRQLFGKVPTDPDAYALASQISQAEAKKYFIERVRVQRPRMSGIIWWNLLDGWPQMSDAVVDYYFEKKLAYRYIKRSQAPFAIVADELLDFKLPIYACNDTLAPLSGHVRVYDADTNETLFEGRITAERNTSTRIADLRIFYSEHRLLLMEWQMDNGACGRNHYLCGFPPFDMETYFGWLEKGYM